MPLPATEINKELCEWAHTNLLKIPKEEDRDYYDKKISGVLIQPHKRSHLEELVIKQKARDYYDMKMWDFETPDEFVQERIRRAADLLGRTDGRAYLEPPVYFNFGYNVAVGKNFYANFNCTFLDWSVIRIGDNVAIGPNCTLTTVNHPLNYDERHSGLYSYPIIIENGVWIGAACTILSGVTIGEGSVIAAGSVVTRDVPAHVVAAGSPARVKAQLRQPRSGVLTPAGEVSEPEEAIDPTKEAVESAKEAIEAAIEAAEAAEAAKETAERAVEAAALEAAGHSHREVKRDANTDRARTERDAEPGSDAKRRKQ